MPVGKKITRMDFEMIKKALKKGTTQRSIHEVLGYAMSTINEVGKAESFEDFEKNKAIRSEDKRKRKEETRKEEKGKQAIEPITRYDTLQIIGTIREQNKLITELIEQMKLINNKVAYLVEQLT